MLIDLIKSFVIGLVEGITEWLPISSSTHIELASDLMKTDYAPSFFAFFEVVIQLGAILAVIILYWGRLWPWASREKHVRQRTWSLWLKILIAALPAAVIGFLIDDWREEHLGSIYIRAAALIVYGILFIVIERLRAKRRPLKEIREAEDIPNATALKIGLFQLLSLVPGTSRSGSTILGGMLVGVSRKAAAEFSFFVAIPVMFGASALKALKFALKGELLFTGSEIAILAVALVTAFAVSMLVVRALIGFLRTHSFEVFGWYRIVLGIAVILYVTLLK
ncbi:MAG: undecaprenyl-diphosphate phosphatase [Clostridia bacterium]|nr:undecaprenyl-diphosphate phosphatase [Clostridia bacterium]